MKKLRNNISSRFLIFTAALVLLILANSFQAFAVTGWSYYGYGWHYVTPENITYKNQTVTIDGVKRTFDARGVCDTGFKEPVRIPPEKDKSAEEKKIEKMADSVLEEILTKGMTDREKCRAIYDWIRSNVSYVNQSVKDNWVQAATDGFRRKSGDCYTFYGVSVALLTRAGLPCIEVTRTTDNRHWWVKVGTDEGWYHFDATPRRRDDGDFCLISDNDLLAYSRSHTNGNGYTTHQFDVSKYPASPEK